MRNNITNPEPVEKIQERISNLEKAATVYMEVQNTVFPYLEQVLRQYWEDDPDYPEEIERIVSAMESSDVYMVGEYCRQYLEGVENHET